jgi:hypothetical protein
MQLLLVFVLPWLVYFSVNKDYMLLFYSIKVFIPLVICIVASAFWLVRSTSITRDTAVLLVYLVMMFGAGLVNGSLISDPAIYGRFLWLMAVPGLAMMLTRIYKDNKRFNYPAIMMSALLYILLMLLYAGFVLNYGLGEESYSYVNNADKGELIRVPVLGGLILIITAIIYATQKDRYLTAATIVVPATTIYVLAFTRSAFAGSLAALLIALLLRGQIRHYQMRGFITLLILFSMLTMSTVALVDDLYFLQATSWSVRLDSVAYVAQSALDDGWVKWLFGHGMYTDEVLRQSVPRSFYPSDVWFFGVFYEFGVIGVVAQFMLVLWYLRRVIEVTRHGASDWHFVVLLFVAVALSEMLFSYWYHNAIVVAFAIASTVAMNKVVRSR